MSFVLLYTGVSSADLFEPAGIGCQIRRKTQPSTKVVAVGMRSRPKQRVRGLAEHHRRAQRRGHLLTAQSHRPGLRGRRRTAARAGTSVIRSRPSGVYRLRSLAPFDLLELAGKCTVLVVAIFWVLEADSRAKERHYRAWDLINAARGSSGDGGRKDALQDLNKDRVSLAAAPLEKAWLSYDAGSPMWIQRP
jgi:hypothetical protein